MAPAPPQIVSLEQLESVAGPGTLTWHPVRTALEEGLALHPGSSDLHYKLACLEALEGRREAAITELRRALALQPELRAHVAADEDLASLRGDRDFEALAGSH